MTVDHIRSRPRRPHSALCRALGRWCILILLGLDCACAGQGAGDEGATAGPSSAESGRTRLLPCASNNAANAEFHRALQADLDALDAEYETALRNEAPALRNAATAALRVADSSRRGPIVVRREEALAPWRRTTMDLVPSYPVMPPGPIHEFLTADVDDGPTIADRLERIAALRIALHGIPPGLGARAPATGSAAEHMSARLRAEVLEALARGGQKGAGIVGLLHVCEAREDPELMKASLEAMGVLRVERARALLSTAIENADWPPFVQDARVLEWACRALIRLSPSDAERVFRRAASASREELSRIERASPAGVGGAHPGPVCHELNYWEYRSLVLENAARAAQERSK